MKRALKGLTCFLSEPKTQTDEAVKSAQQRAVIMHAHAFCIGGNRWHGDKNARDSLDAAGRSTSVHVLQWPLHVHYYVDVYMVAKLLPVVELTQVLLFLQRDNRREALLGFTSSKYC